MRVDQYDSRTYKAVSHTQTLKCRKRLSDWKGAKQMSTRGTRNCKLRQGHHFSGNESYVIEFLQQLFRIFNLDLSVC